MTATSASRRTSPGLIAAIALAAAAIASAPARAQFVQQPAPPDIEGLTVVGKATVGARPNLAEVELDVSASAELTGDAIVKFRDSKKRVRDAFAALKLANVAVEERGLLVDQKGATINPYYIMEYGQNTKTKTEVQLSRKLVVRASEIAAMDEDAVLQLVGRLLDVAQDAGARVGPSADMNMYYYRYGMQPTTGLVRFVVEDYEQVREKAYERAVADARSRAERLARLSGVELGPVLAIREVVVPEGQAASPMAILMPTPAHDDDDAPRERLESSKFQEIPVRVELQLRFAIKPRADGDAGRPSQ